MNKLYFIILILLFHNSHLSSQEVKGPFVRDIEIKSADTLIKTQILLSVKKMDINTDQNIKYYWYFEGAIHVNQSGFSGSPLHGNYSVYDKKGNLLVKGEYLYGTRAGKWFYWLTNGTLNKIEIYKKGKLSETRDILNPEVKKTKSWFSFRKSEKLKPSQKDSVNNVKVTQVEKNVNAKTDTVAQPAKKRRRSK